MTRDPRVRELPDYAGPVEDSADFLVIGSGPGGAIAARRLAATGKSVILVEAGPVVRLRDMRKEAGHTLSKFFWESGLRTTTGGNVVMPTLQGRALGGGSLFNSAICMRIPEYALARWREDHGVRLSMGDLEPHFEAVEDFMHVKPVDADVQGRNNTLFAEACEKTGLRPTPIERNEDGCRGSGECMTGCPNKAKLSMDLRGVPEIVAMGGRVYTGVAIDRLTLEGDRVTGAVGHVVDGAGERRYDAKFRAKCVVLAAGAIATPLILMRSGFKKKPVGDNLQFHPATAMMGIFDEEILPWAGASQGYHCLDYLQQGIKLEALWAIPSLLSFRFPGVGHEFKELLSDYRNMACWDIWVSGADSKGTVRPMPGLGRPRITYQLAESDMRRLQFGMEKITEMFFAVGAKRVLHGVSGLPISFDKPSDLALLKQKRLRPGDLLVGSNHVFGTTSMGGDPSKYAVDEDGAVYGLRNCYVADTGIFPATTSSNPMLTVMALADRTGKRIAERHG